LIFNPQVIVAQGERVAFLEPIRGAANQAAKNSAQIERALFKAIAFSH
jgi:hypothetical protein